MCGKERGGREGVQDHTDSVEVSLAGAATGIICVATKVSLPRQNYVFATNKHIYLSRQTRVCHNKSKLVTTKVCREKHVHTFVATKDVFCCDKHTFVATKDVFITELLSRQKRYLWQLPPIIWKTRDKKSKKRRSWCPYQSGSCPRLPTQGRTTADC